MEGQLFFVDRVEDGTAVLLAEDGGEGEALFPLALLPKGTAEGDWLRVSFERDDARRDRARAEIGRLMDELGDNP